MAISIGVMRGCQLRPRARPGIMSESADGGRPTLDHVVGESHGPRGGATSVPVDNTVPRTAVSARQRRSLMPCGIALEAVKVRKVVGSARRVVQWSLATAGDWYHWVECVVTML